MLVRHRAHESLPTAGEFVHAAQARQGTHIACLEDIAHLNGWIGADRLIEISDTKKNSQHGRYLRDLALG